MKQLYLRMEDDLWRKVKDDAEANGKSLNSYICWLLENWEVKPVIKEA